MLQSHAGSARLRVVRGVAQDEALIRELGRYLADPAAVLDAFFHRDPSSAERAYETEARLLRITPSSAAHATADVLRHVALRGDRLLDGDEWLALLRTGFPFRQAAGFLDPSRGMILTPHNGRLRLVALKGAPVGWTHEDRQVIIPVIPAETASDFSRPSFP